MHNRLKKRKLIIFLLIMFLIIVQLSVHGYFSLETITHNKDILRSLVANYYLYAVFFYIALYALAVICLLPFVSFITMLGGFLFGTLWATIFIATGATVGITVLVSLMRSFFKNKASLQSSFLQRFNTMVQRHGTAYLLCVRFIVIIPFFVVNSVLAFTTISVFTIAWTTCVGILPVTLLFASAGSHLEQIHHVSDLISAKVIMVFGCLALVSLMPIILEKFNIKL